MRWGLLDGIDELLVGDRARGHRVWSADLPFFEDHFPKFPVVPGVLTLESLAQLSGKLIGYTVRHQRGDWPFPILSMMEGVKFRKFIRPDERVILDTRIVHLRDEMAACEVKASVNGKVHATAQQIFVFNAVPLENDLDRATVEAAEREALKRLWVAFPGDF